MKKRDSFILFTCIIEAAIASLYIFKGSQEGYNHIIIAIIAANLLYIPGCLFFRRLFFYIWNVIYSLVLIILMSKTPSLLHNNYSALFAILIISLVKPEYKWIYIGMYGTIITLAFMIDGEQLYDYLIHIARSTWYIYLETYYLAQKYIKKQLDLTADEVMILEEMIEKKQQKACTCFSKNTISQKLREARRRNHCDTTQELLTEYKLNK